MKIGIYGGTFDPPHLGHMDSARAAIKALGLDRLLFLPAHEPPHKTMSDCSASPEDRLAMVSLMADGLGAGVEVCELEYKREGKSYTVDTLQALREMSPEDEFWLLMGSDMFLSLQSWRQADVILSLAEVAAFARTETDRERLERQKKVLEKQYGARVCLVELPAIREVSSTELRKGEGWDQLYPPVLGYILRKGLYGSQADLTHLTDPQLRACSLSMIKAKRIPHILGTEVTAVALARRWGAEEELARRAAILHDCTKYWTMEEHLACCKRYGVELDELELRSEKLLHSKTGACMAKEVYGQPQAVCEAIFYHTTGKAHMTLLEKILYMADYIEPNRKFDGVEELRRLAETDLDAALLLGCEMSIAEMEERGYQVHRNTLAARDWLKGTCQ